MGWRVNTPMEKSDGGCKLTMLDEARITPSTHDSTQWPRINVLVQCNGRGTVVA